MESPYVEGVPDWGALYRARGDEVAATRPIFTGDVFTGVELSGSTGKIKARSVLVLQHPCSMRTNGVDLAWKVLVAEVANRKELDEQSWVGGHFNLMPLPGSVPILRARASIRQPTSTTSTRWPRSADLADCLPIAVRGEHPSSAMGALQLPSRGANPYLPSANRCLLRRSGPDRRVVRRGEQRGSPGRNAGVPELAADG